MKIGQLGSVQLGMALSALESAHLGSARGFVLSSVQFGLAPARARLVRGWLKCGSTDESLFRATYPHGQSVRSQNVVFDTFRMGSQ